MPFVAESTGEENASPYKGGVNEGSRGELLDASELLERLDVFGKDTFVVGQVAILAVTYVVTHCCLYAAGVRLPLVTNCREEVFSDNG
jgi:hypothetical protein